MMWQLSVDPFGRSRNHALELLPPSLASVDRGADHTEESHQNIERLEKKREAQDWDYEKPGDKEEKEKHMPADHTPISERLMPEEGLVSEARASEGELVAELHKNSCLMPQSNTELNKAVPCMVEDHSKLQELEPKKRNCDRARRKEQKHREKIRIESQFRQSQHLGNMLAGTAAQLEQWKRDIAKLKKYDRGRRHASEKPEIPHLPIWLAHCLAYFEKEVHEGEEALKKLSYHREAISTMSDRHRKAVRKPTNIEQIDDMIQLTRDHLPNAFDAVGKPTSTEQINDMIQTTKDHLPHQSSDLNNVVGSDLFSAPSSGRSEKHGNIFRDLAFSSTVPTQKENPGEVVHHEQARVKKYDFHRDGLAGSEPTSIEQINDTIQITKDRLPPAPNMISGSGENGYDLHDERHRSFSQACSSDKASARRTQDGNLSSLSHSCVQWNLALEGNVTSDILYQGQQDSDLNNVFGSEVFSAQSSSRSEKHGHISRDLAFSSNVSTQNARPGEIVHHEQARVKEYERDGFAGSEPTGIEQINDMLQITKARLPPAPNMISGSNENGYDLYERPKASSPACSDKASDRSIRDRNRSSHSHGYVQDLGLTDSVTNDVLYQLQRGSDLNNVVDSETFSAPSSGRSEKHGNFFRDLAFSSTVPTQNEHPGEIVHHEQARVKEYDFHRDGLAGSEPTSIEQINDMVQITKDLLPPAPHMISGSGEYGYDLHDERLRASPQRTQDERTRVKENGFYGIDPTTDLILHQQQQRSDVNGGGDAETSSAMSSNGSAKRRTLVDLFALAPMDHEHADGDVEWIANLESFGTERGEASAQESHGRKATTSPEITQRSYYKVFTWNALEQHLEKKKKRIQTDHIESPEFELSGEPGFYLRYWPDWDVARSISCLRLFGPKGFHGDYRLGIGQECFRDVELNQESNGNAVSQAWFFASSEVKFDSNLEDVWVGEPEGLDWV